MDNLNINRSVEQDQVRLALSGEGFSLITLSGRAGIGKAELLRQALKDQEASFLRIPNLADAGQVKYWQYYFPEFADQAWPDFFKSLADRYRDRAGILVLLNFERLLDLAPKLETALRRAIREDFIGTQLKLLLVYDYTSPGARPKTLARGFYQQAAQLNLDLSPFSYRQSLTYLPDWPAEDRLYAYSISGGVLAYLKVLARYPDLGTAIKQEFINPDGYLQSLPGLILADNLREPAVYQLLLMAIADGAERQKDIAEAAMIPASSAANYLRVLLELGLLEKNQPYRNNNPRLTRYTIKEPIFRFYYHFLPKLDPLRERGLWTEAYGVLKDKLADYFHSDFVAIARDYLLAGQASGDLSGDFDDFQPWWNESGQTIDLVASDAQTALLASCLWAERKMGVEDLQDLRNLSRLTQRRKQKIYTLFSRSGFSSDLLDLAADADDVSLISLFGEA